MTASDDIVSKADAFMHRPRPVVAGVDDAELPLLTEVVTPSPALTRDSGSAAGGAITAGVSEEVVAALTRALDGWLEREVPIVVAQVLDGVVDRISSEVSARARSELLPRLLQAAKPATPQE